MDDLTTRIDTYFEIWNEPDTNRRDELGQQVWTREGRYVDPFADTSGSRGFADHVGMAHERYPGHTVRRASGIDIHHDQARFKWELVGPDGKVVAEGIDVCVLDDDGKLEQVAGFVGDLSAVEALAV